MDLASYDRWNKLNGRFINSGDLLKLNNKKEYYSLLYAMAGLNDYFCPKAEEFIEVYSIVKSYKLNILAERLKVFGFPRQFSSNTFSRKISTLFIYENFILRINLRLLIHLGSYPEYFRLRKYNSYVHACGYLDEHVKYALVENPEVLSRHYM